MMARARRTYPLQGTLLSLSAIGLLGLSLLAWTQQPTATLIAHLPDQGQFSYALEEGSMDWWRLAVSLQGDAEEQGDWTLYEGDDLLGYRLQWKADTLTWTIQRQGPGPGLLARGVLPKRPKSLEWMRHQSLLTLTVDGAIVCQVIDLMPNDPARSWGVDFAGIIPQIRVDLHDDSFLATPISYLEEIEDRDAQLQAQVARETTALANLKNRIQEMLIGRRGIEDTDRAFVTGRIASSIADIPKEIRPQMQAWVLWASASATIQNREGFDEAVFNVFIDQIRLGQENGDQIPLIPGFFHNLAMQAAGRARDLPVGAAPAKGFIHRRKALLRTVAMLTANNPEVFAIETMDESLERQFCEALARGLAGERPPATPAEAPRWMVDRWRSVSGTNPIELPMTPITVAEPARPWVRGTLDELLTLADLRPAAAVRLRARTLAAVANGRMEDLKAALSDPDIPHRENLLSSAILATRGIVDPLAALRALTASSEGSLAIAERDPLAYALYHLLLHRQLQEAATSGVDLLGAELPPALTPHQRLLSGAAEATTIAFGDPSATLRPPEALAAALVMQEVRGYPANWGLLADLPSMVLPLSLLAPVESETPGPPAGAGDQP